MHTSEVRKRPQLNLRELYQVNWFLGAALALLSIWPTLHLQYAVLPHVVVTWILLGIAILRPQITAWVPKLVWHAVPFSLIILLAIDLRLSSEPIPALIRLNILLVLYRCLAFRRKREDLQLMVLCLFLLIIAGVLTVALSFVVQVLLFSALAMSFLFNITLMEDSRDTLAPKEVWKDFRWSHFLRKLWACCDAGFFVVAGVAFCSVVVFSTLLFLMIPRFDIDNPIPFLGMGGRSQTGFSESIRFGDVTNIRSNDRVALRVEVDTKGEIPTDPYWRMLVLDEYDDGTFQLSRALQHAANTSRQTSVRYDDELIGQMEAPDAANVWTFYLEGGVARYLPLTGLFGRIRFQEPHDLVYVQPSHVLGNTRASSSMLVYQVENMELGGAFKDPAFGTYTLDFDRYPEMSIPYDYRVLNYPETTVALPTRKEDVEYLRGLADEIGEGRALTAEEFAERAASYIQDRHSYSTSYAIPRGNADHVVRWLQSDQPGHCEVFAGALILLCRTVGIPARAVTGFRGGAWNTYENYFMIRNSDAHAWVEIFDGLDSWIRFDPTPGGSTPSTVGAGDVALGHISSDSSFGAYLDSFRILWYRRIVSFDQKAQYEVWTMIQDGYERIDIKSWFAALKDFIATWWQAPWDVEKAARMLGLGAAVGLGVLLVQFCRQRIRGAQRSGRETGKTDPVRRKAGRQLRRLRLYEPGELEDPLFDEVVLDLQRLRYGCPERRENWKRVIKRARRLPVRRR